MLVLCADFILPFQTIAWRVEQTAMLPAALTDSPLWSMVVLAQHVWALALILIALLAAATWDAGGCPGWVRCDYSRGRAAVGCTAGCDPRRCC